MRTVKDLNYKLKVHILVQFQKHSFPLLLLFEHMSIFFRTLSKGSRRQSYTVRNTGTFTKSVLSGTLP